MKLRLLVVALIAVLGTGCATTDKSGLAGYKIKPDTTVRHGAESRGRRSPARPRGW